MRQSSTNMHPEQLKYANRNPIARYANRLFLETIHEMLYGVAFSSLLDVGCGEGITLQQAGMISPSAKLMGFDLDRRRVGKALQTVAQAGLFVGDTHHIPFETATFDIVLCIETLEHVGEPMIAIAEIARVTRNYALFSVPNEPWWRIGNLARFRYLRDLGNTPGHINHWTTSGFKKMIASEFRILKWKMPFLWNFVLAEKLS